MSFVMIPEELLEVDITSAQLRALIHIMNNTYSTGKYAGCCCLGYQNLASLCFTNKSAMIKLIKQLESMGFLEVNTRERFNRSNAIKLTLENGLNRCRHDLRESAGTDSERCQNNTFQGCLKDTFQGCLKDTEGCLNDTLGCLNDTPYIDLKFKNQDLKNKYNGERCLKHTFQDPSSEEEKATAATPAVRSMSNESSASKSGEFLAQEAKDQALFALIKNKFPDFDLDFELSRGLKNYYIRKISKFSLTNNIFAEDIAAYAKENGYPLQSTAAYIQGETIIKGVA